LFKGCKPWPCAKVLERLHMDIQPLDYQPRPYGVGWRQADLPPLKPYTPEEQELIRERLCSFTSLLGLELGGDAMTSEILEDFSFAPKLRKVILCVPVKSNDYSNSIIQKAREMAQGRGEALFPNWIVASGFSCISSRGACYIDADI
ncbi:hypothetical protein BGZ54_006015, partial [Gamsiella multidivaricata]